MAGKGAATGAAAGAVGGMVSALVFGGDVGEAAARGMVWGGSTGAVSGAIAGAQADHAKKTAEQKAELERLKQQLGEDAFNGLSALAECKHEVSLGYARTAAQSDTPSYALAGLWLEAITFGDRGDSAQVDAILPDLIAKDPKINSDADARMSLDEALAKLKEIRKEYKLPESCE